MCGKAPAPPPVVAPPAPIPARDEIIEGRQARQNAARRASTSGYQATMLTDQSTMDASSTTAALGA